MLPATILAYLAVLLLHYNANRRWSFAARPGRPMRVVRYAIAMATNLGLTVVVIALLVRVGVFYLIAKVLAVALNALLNFVVFRRWVFADEGQLPSAVAR